MADDVERNNNLYITVLYEPQLPIAFSDIYGEFVHLFLCRIFFFQQRSMLPKNLPKNKSSLLNTQDVTDKK